MPAYDYACKACGHSFEKNQSMSEAPLKICPECGTDGLRKLFSPVGIVFKGSGFYKNDSQACPNKTPSCETGSCPMAS